MADTPDTPDPLDTSPSAGDQMNHASPGSPESAVEDRLTSDSARWAHNLPAADTLTAWASALPEPTTGARLPTPTQTIRATRGAPVASAPDVASAPITSPDIRPLKGRRPMPPPRSNSVRILAPVAAVVVVALMATVFVALARSGHGSGLGAQPNASATSIRATPTAAAVQPGIYPVGEQASHLSVVVATSVNKQGQPVTTGFIFHPGATVNLVVTLEDTSAATSHTITVVWFSNSNRYGVVSATVGPYSASYVTQHGKPFQVFSVAYKATGSGLAKVYWDAKNPSSPNDDRALAVMAIFLVQ